MKNPSTKHFSLPANSVFIRQVHIYRCQRNSSSKNSFIAHYSFALMTASMPDHSLSWDRVLPAPHALLNGLTNDLPPRRTSSLLQHHLVSSKDLLESSRERRSTVTSISYHQGPQLSPARPISVLQFPPDSSTSDQPTKVPLTRKRAASLMADEVNTRETSPVTTQDSISGKTNQFCLCQPDPKIPRPRNGMFLSRPCPSYLGIPS